MKKYFLLAALSILAAVSCTKPPYINVDMSSFEVPAAGETVTVTVDANCDWTISSSATWIKPKRNQEAGTLDLVIAKNTTTDDREGKITLNGGDVYATIAVKQKQMNSVVIEGTGQLSITADEQVFEIVTSRNVSYKAEIPSSATWLSLVELKSMSAGCIKLKATANTGHSPREARINLTADDFAGVSFTVIQSGRQMILSFVAGATGKLALPEITNGSAAATVEWNGKSEAYSSGMYIDIPLFPMPVSIKTTNITSVKFADIVGIDSIDITDLN